MIPASIFQIAQGHAAALKETTGKSITPVGRSTLSELVAHSYIGVLPESDQVSMADVLAAATSDDMDGPSIHSAILGSRIDSLVPLVASHISFVKNEVCKAMYAFEEKYGTEVGKIESATPYGMFDIREMTMAAPMENAGISDLVERFADMNSPIPPLLQTLPAQSADQLLEFMRVSSNSANESINKWISDQGHGWLEAIWQHYFASASVTPNPAFVFRGGYAGMASMPAFERLNVGLAVFLLARGLMDEPMEGAGMGLSQWRQDMDIISRFAGGQARHAMSMLDMIKRQQIVILGVSNQGKTVSVNSEFYGKFIDAGGTIEDVLGAALSNRTQTYSYDTLTSEGSGFREIWRNYQAMGQSSLNARAVITLRAEAKALFNEATKGLEGEEAQLLALSGLNAESLYQRGCDMIDNMGLDQLRDSSKMAMELIAGLRYAHTPAKQFLCDMKEAEAAGCTEPSEAVLLAAINYVADAASAELALTTA